MFEVSRTQIAIIITAIALVGFIVGTALLKAASYLAHHLQWVP